MGIGAHEALPGYQQYSRYSSGVYMNQNDHGAVYL
jgi:hypothetical protein